MAASRRSPNLSGKPNLRWIPLGPRIGENPASLKESDGARMAYGSDKATYLFVRAAVGDDWHAIKVQNGKSETIGTGTMDDAYRYCVNLYHWGIVSPTPQDPRRRAG